MSVSAEILRSYVDYTVWANLRMLDAAAELLPEELTRDFGTADHSVVGTLAHIFAADRLWLAFVAGTPEPGRLSDADRTLAALQNAWPALLGRWKGWAAQLTGDRLCSPIAYQLKGQSCQQPLWQIVLHVVNHGTQHRGQVSGFLRSLGHTPPPVDLDYYYRQP